MVDYAVREKYESALNEEERKIVWREHFQYGCLLCKEAGWPEGVDVLRKQQREKGIPDLDARQTDYQAICDRLNREGDLFLQWMIQEPDAVYKKLHMEEKIETAAIYGFSRLGRALKFYLDKYGIEVRYIIDQKGQMLNIDKKVYMLNDELEEVDAIIITPIGLYDEIKTKLEKKLECKFFNIEKLIAE